jgi:helicase
MRVDALEAYDIPAEILAIWRATIGPELLPVQVRAVKECGLFGDRPLFVFSPTSSGKTFVGEMAAVHAARGNTKVFYAVPMKALAEEKYQEFRRRYEPVGIRVVVTSRDHRDHDADIEAGRFDIAIVVFEKLQALLVSRPHLMETVGLIVVDELQLLTDPKRGPSLELLLTKLHVAGSKPRIIGLSAVIGQAKLLADWLGAKMLVDARRPIELRKGVYQGGLFRYIEHNSGTIGTEQFVDPGTNDRDEVILSLAQQLVAAGEQVLVFVPDRASTVSLARAFARRVGLPKVGPALAELADQEATFAREALTEAFAGAAGFHNSDLSTFERALVERNFRCGALRAVFATTTLAMGVNLPARNVIIDGRKWERSERYHRMACINQSKSEIENESGRAGRYGFGEPFGRAFLLADSRFQAEALFRQFVRAELDEIAPMLTRAPLEEHIVSLVASGMARSIAQLEELLLASLTGFAVWSKDRAALRADLERALAVCADGGLVRIGTGWVVAPTELGHACASKGLSVPTAVDLATWAREARSAVVSPIEVLAVASLTPDGADILVNLGTAERYQNDYRGELLRRAEVARAGDRPFFERLAMDQSGVEYEAALAYKKTLLLTDWIEELPAAEIERRFHTWAGALRRLGEEFGWLVDALAAVAHAVGWTKAQRAGLVELADRLHFGVRANALPIARLRIDGLGRALARRLVDAGLGDLSALEAADRALLQRTLGHARAFAALEARLDATGMVTPAPYPALSGGERPLVIAEAASSALVAATPVVGVAPAVAELVPPAAAAATEVALSIDLRTLTVSFHGHEIPTRPPKGSRGAPKHLQRTPLLALAALAMQPGCFVSMGDLAAAMYELGALAKKPVAPEAREIRYRTLLAFRAALEGKVPKGEIDRLIESSPQQGLRLNVDGEVRVITVARAAE